MIVILQSIGIIVRKSKVTRVVTYTGRYSNGHLIPIIQSCQDEIIEIKYPLEYLPVYMTILVTLLFLTIVPYWL